MKFLPHVALLALGVWFGGLIALILFVSTLFMKARAAAFEAAPVLFNTFEQYQLGVAAVAMLALVLWRLNGVTRLKTVAVALTLAATVLAVVQIAVISPRVNASRNVDRPTFDRYHSLSTKNYSGIALLVLAAWVVTSAAGRRALTPFAAEQESNPNLATVGTTSPFSRGRSERATLPIHEPLRPARARLTLTPAPG